MLNNCCKYRYPLLKAAARSDLQKAVGSLDFRLTGFCRNASFSESVEYRTIIAPWLHFGKYQKGLLSHLKTWEMLRALAVLQICSVDAIVDRSSQLLSLSNKFGGKFAQYFVRKTFYEQFVGGNDVEEMQNVVNGLHRRGLTLMVAPVLEEDVEDEKSCNDVYEQNCKTLKGLAQMTSSMDKDKPIVQLKLSAIIPAKTLEQVNACVMSEWRNDRNLARLVEQLSKRSTDWTHLSSLKKGDMEHFISGVKRADEFVQLAKRLNVKVLVDAEFYSCQLAISTVALVLMAKYNAENYVVGDTIQGYLKEAHERVSMEMRVCQKLIGCNWYGKIVRGAYMDKERVLAKKLGYASPICESYEETNRSYDKCIETVLCNLADKSLTTKSHLLVASHNEKSIRLAAQNMQQLHISQEDDLVSFAQIYGMADYLSEPLVKANYKVYKSTPYGPLEKVMPYLSRRASENRSVVKGAREERIMLRKELFTRIFG